MWSMYCRLLFIALIIYFLVMLIAYTEENHNRLKRSLVVKEFLNRTEVISDPFEKSAKDGKLRTILLWTTTFNDDDAFKFGFGEDLFVGENRCPVDDCLVTKNRSYMDIEDYDVIVYYLWSGNMDDFKPPKRRNPKQYYAFASLDHSDAIRTAPKDFYNWTITYRQDSDFHWPHYRIIDLYNTSRVVAPVKSPEWIEHRDKIVDVSKTLPNLNKKHKKAAWFVSHCISNNRREKYVAELQKYIEIDIYGKCGSLQNKRNDQNDPNNRMLQIDYYFYLAFENNDCFDYVTEKAVHPLQHDVIPIVFGSANYTQHLPPHSYINAKEYEPKKLAELMDRIIANQTEYAQYFWWKDYYKLYNIGIATVNALPYLHPFCDICKALQDPNLPGKRYDDINAWWVGNKTHPACTYTVNT